MNIQRLAEQDIQNFIFEHEKDDEDRLVLKSKTMLGLPSSWIAAQIKARKKTVYKLPLFYQTKGVVYPPSLNLEQCSSEATARFKKYITSKWITSGKKFCDLTGGFGVDALFMSSLFPYTDFSEPDTTLIEVAEHNHQLLGSSNIHYHNKNAADFMSASGKHYDLIYVDPSRRSTTNKKVFQFADCEPDVVGSLEELYRHADRLMIKASPLLDIQQGIKDLQHVARVLVVSVDNDCKELLFLCDRKSTGETVVECYNLPNNFNAHKIPVAFEFRFSEERSAAATFSDPLKFIYEPNTSIMKGGAFKSIATEFKVRKLAANTHLYTSAEVIDDFPGRVFEIKEFVKPDKKLRGKANILIRNYPLSVDEIKKKTGITDGGDKYLIACSGVKEKWMFTANRVR
ncbi:MAG TPA: hypothetical protein VFE50_26445 [Cyclobacteriaceae bacterium]|nr:hypothetical protein [Cyclobacteriaceae bacterium]